MNLFLCSLPEIGIFGHGKVISPFQLGIFFFWKIHTGVFDIFLKDYGTGSSRVTSKMFLLSPFMTSIKNNIGYQEVMNSITNSIMESILSLIDTFLTTLVMLKMLVNMILLL